MAIGYIIGILVGLYFRFSIVLLYVPIVLIYFIIKNRKNRKRKFNFLNPKRYLKYSKLILKNKNIIIILLVSIISNSIVIFQNNKYATLYKDCESVEIEAIVLSKKTQKEYNDIYKIKIIEINKKQKYKDTYLNIQVNKKIKLEYGDKIQIKGKFIEPETSRNYGGFNYKEYLKILKIYGTIKGENINIISKENINPVFLLSNKVLLKIEKKLDKVLKKEQSKIVKGIFLGDKSDIEEDIKENFKISRDITHIISIWNACFVYYNNS